MTSIYSTLFYSGTPTAGTPTTVFAVPAGRVAVVRDIDVVLVSGAPGDIGVYDLNTSTFFAYMAGSAAFDTAQWRGRQVFIAGDFINVYAPSGTWNTRISGYLLRAT